MKKLILILGFVIAITPLFAQVDDDAQLFGERGVSSYYASFTTNDITSDQFTHSFTIKNTKPYAVTITSISVPEGVAILVPQKTIPPLSEAKIIATVYKDYNSGNFKKDFSVYVSSQGQAGISSIQKYNFMLSGSFK